MMKILDNKKGEKKCQEATEPDPMAKAQKPAAA